MAPPSTRTQEEDARPGLAAPLPLAKPSQALSRVYNRWKHAVGGARTTSPITPAVTGGGERVILLRSSELMHPMNHIRCIGYHIRCITSDASDLMHLMGHVAHVYRHTHIYRASVCVGGSGGGGNPMHRTHRILMRAIGWVAVKIFLTSGVHAGAGSYC